MWTLCDGSLGTSPLNKEQLTIGNPEVIMFVVNASINVTTINIYVKLWKEVSLSEVFA